MHRFRLEQKSCQRFPTSAPPISKETLRYREMIPQIEKRDGRLVPFDFDKIAVAIWKAMAAAEEGDQEDANLVAHQVVGELGRFAKKYKNFLPTVEGIQDSVEKYLILNDYVKTAKGYILYRDKRAQMRASARRHPRKHVQQSSPKKAENILIGMRSANSFICDSYAKWIPMNGRRETWVETVDRLYEISCAKNLGDKVFTEKEYAEVRTRHFETRSDAVDAPHAVFRRSGAASAMPADTIVPSSRRP